MNWQWEWEQIGEDTGMPYHATFRENSGQYEARVKWDGCLELVRYFNKPAWEHKEDDLRDQIHICDIDEMIALLTTLKKKATEYFKPFHGEWPG